MAFSKDDRTTPESSQYVFSGYAEIMAANNCERGCFDSTLFGIHEVCLFVHDQDSPDQGYQPAREPHYRFYYRFLVCSPFAAQHVHKIFVSLGCEQ